MTVAWLQAGEAKALVEAVTVSIATAAAEVTLVHQKSAAIQLASVTTTAPAAASVQLASVTTGSE